MRKILTLLIAFMASATSMQAEIYSGTCGYNLTWWLNTEDSTLTINGTGEMENYLLASFVPWAEHKLYVKYLSLSHSITSIGEHAFDGCKSLTSVTIPNSITSIGKGAFSNCTGLTEVHINNLYAWCNISFAALSSNPLGYAKHLYLKETEITNLVIPNIVTEIKNYAFYHCVGLTSIEIPNSVISIGAYAFSSCKSLTNVTISNNVISIGEDAFLSCSGLTSVIISNSVETIGKSAFYGCSELTSVTMGNSVTSIGEHAFYYCKGLKEVHVSDLSAWCNISFENEPSNPLYYAKHLYMNEAEIVNLVIPNNVTEIKRYAFYNCAGLTSVTIPNSVTSIGYKAFYYCTGLTSITCYIETPLTIGSLTFYKADKDIPLYVLAESVELYKKSSSWDDFKNILPIQATEIEVDDFTINWFENNFVLSWYAIENANTYTIEVKDNKDNVVCVLIFNAQGALQSLHFAAPARNGNKQVQTATQTSEGWQFVLNYLDPDQQYTFTLIVKDSEGKELYYKSITNSSTPTSIDNTSIDNTKSAKLLRNGQVLILRGDHTYTHTGQQVK